MLLWFCIFGTASSFLKGSKAFLKGLREHQCPPASIDLRKPWCRDEHAKRFACNSVQHGTGRGAHGDMGDQIHLLQSFFLRWEDESALMASPLPCERIEWSCCSDISVWEVWKGAQSQHASNTSPSPLRYLAL